MNLKCNVTKDCCAVRKVYKATKKRRTKNENSRLLPINIQSGRKSGERNPIIASVLFISILNWVPCFPSPWLRSSLPLRYLVILSSLLNVIPTNVCLFVCMRVNDVDIVDYWWLESVYFNIRHWLYLLTYIPVFPLGMNSNSWGIKRNYHAVKQQDPFSIRR